MINKFLECNRNRRLKIAVIGDVLIDQFFQVNVERISPEAPVPILHSQSDQPRVACGGAANVAYQFKHWNVDCDLYGIMDEDAYRIFESFGLNVIPYFEGYTPRKNRFYDIQSLMRWDVEKKNCYSEKAYKSLLSEFKLHKYDWVICSDYDKGLFRWDFTRRILEAHPNTVVDPKTDHMKWKGCRVFKPNSKEANSFSGGSDKFLIEECLAQVLECDVVVTCGGAGVCGVEKKKWFNVKPTQSQKISDRHAIYGFSGCGDCFLATLTMALGHGFTLPEASKIAWEAGAAYIKTEHNQPVYPLDLYKHKYVDPKDLANRDFKLVVANGCFDILHYAHVELLEFAKKQGDKLAVLVNSDESIKRLKGDDRPINSLCERMRLLAGLESVDYVIAFEEATPAECIGLTNADVLVKGGDYSLDKIVSAPCIKNIVPFPYNKDYSTTKLIEKIKDRNDDVQS